MISSFYRFPCSITSEEISYTCNPYSTLIFRWFIEMAIFLNTNMKSSKYNKMLKKHPAIFRINMNTETVIYLRKEISTNRVRREKTWNLNHMKKGHWICQKIRLYSSLRVIRSPLTFRINNHIILNSNNLHHGLF